MGKNAAIDTSPFREAVWNYCQCLFGIRHDDYNYHCVNELMEIPLKLFCKNVACFPQLVTDSLRDSVMTDFEYSEKVRTLIASPHNAMS